MEARKHVVKLETLKDVNDILTDANIQPISREEHRKISANQTSRNNLSRLIELIADNRINERERMRATNDLAKMRAQISGNENEESASSERPGQNRAAASTPAQNGVITIARDTISDEDMRYMNHTAYGAKAAFVVLMAKSRANGDLSGHYTINIEAAKATEGASRKYEWSDKVTLQLTQGELLTVAAVFYGYKESCTFSSHGPAKDKGFSLERKDEGIIARVNATGKSMAVKISPPDIFMMGAIITRQILKETPWLDSVSMEQLLRGSFIFGAPVSQQPAQNATGKPANQNNSALQCSGCGCGIDQRVHDYSVKNKGKPLCLKCQKSH